MDTFDTVSEQTRRFYTFPSLIMKELIKSDVFAGHSDEKELINLTTQLVDYMVPPHFPCTIKEAIRYLKLFSPVDCPLNVDELCKLDAFWKSIEDDSEIKSFQDIPNYRTQYPLFYAFQRIQRTFNTSDNGRNSVITGFFLDNLNWRNIDQDSKNSVDRYYRDILALRDTLLGKIPFLDNSKLNCESIEVLSASLLEQAERVLQQLETQPDVESRKSQLSKINAIIRLLTIDKALGSIAFERNDYGRLSVKIDSVSTVHASDSLEKDEWDLLEKSQPKRKGIRDNESEDTPRNYKRTGGSSQTSVKDDLANYKPVVQSMEARNTIAISDMNRLPLSILARFFNFLAHHDRLLFCFAWLLFTTGLRPVRLVKLKHINKNRPSKTPGVFFDSSKNILSYDIRGGATDFDSPKDNKPSRKRIMRIALPEQVASILAESGKRTPFSSAISALDDLSISFKQQHPGVRPTAERISASFWCHIAPQIRELIAANLCGNIPSRYRAQSHYYAFSIHAINQQYQFANRQLLAEFKPRLPSDAKLWDFINQPNFANIRDGIIGSQVSVQLESLTALVTALNERCDAQLIHRDSVDIEKSIEAHIEFINTQHLILFLLQQLVVSLRQVGKKAHIATALHFGIWARDKDSSQFAERRVIPFSELLADYQAICESDFNSLERRLRRYGFSIEDSNHGKQRNLAMHITRSRSGNDTFNANVLTTSKFLETLEILQLDTYFPVHANVIRHINATELYEFIPQPHLDELLGHERGGMDVFAPFSTIQPQHYFNHFQQLDKRIRKLPFRIQQWEKQYELKHHRIH